MSTSYGRTITFNCGNDHRQGESCHGKHTVRIVWHNTSDTVAVEIDGEIRMIVTDAGYAAMCRAMELDREGDEEG